MKKLITEWFGDGKAEGSTYFLVFATGCALLYGTLLYELVRKVL